MAYIPEMQFDLQQEAERVREIMDKIDCVNIFFAEGAGMGVPGAYDLEGPRPGHCSGKVL